MQITGAFLAEHAEVVDNKLNVIGGVLDWIAVPRAGQFNDAGDMLMGFGHLITLMQAGPDDHQKPYRMITELVDGSGVPRVVGDETISIDAHSGENRFWITHIGIAEEIGGRRTLIQTIEGGGSIAIPFEVRVVD